MSNADNFVITRRRKKYKFAKFAEFNNCFELKEWVKTCHCEEPQATKQFSKTTRHSTFQPFRVKGAGPKQQVVLEIGAGSALFLVELASRHPENFYIAIDIKGDRLYRGARRATEEKVDNIVFIRSEIQHLPEIVPAHIVDEIWLTFSDPYPRKSDAKHRLTAPRYLELYRQVLRFDLRGGGIKTAPNQVGPGNGAGILHFKTDNQPLFDWSVEQFNENGWQIDELTRDLHISDLPEHTKIMTSYEEKFVADGLPIYYLNARPS